MVERVSGSSDRYRDSSSSDRRVQVKFDNRGQNLVTTGDEIDIFVVKEAEKGSRWYSVDDRDLQHPYKLLSERRGKLRYLVPEYPDTTRPTLPYLLRNALEDPIYAGQIQNMSPFSSKIINGYEFVTIVTKINGKNVKKQFYASINSFDASGNLAFRSLDNPNDTNTYKAIRNGARIEGVERVTDTAVETAARGSSRDSFVPSEEAPKRMMNVGGRGKATSRHEESLDNLLSSTNYPKRGYVSGKYFYSDDGRAFIKDDKKGVYYEIKDGRADKSTSYQHYQHGDKRIMDYLLPENAVPFPRSIAVDFASLYADDKPVNPKRTIRIAPGHGKIVIPEKLRAPGEDGVTVFDSDKYPPGSPEYIHWNHGTAPDMLKDAGIIVKPQFYSQGRRLRTIEIEFTKNGVFEVNNKIYTVTDDGITVEDRDIKLKKPKKSEIVETPKPKTIPMLNERALDILSKRGKLENPLKLYSDDQLVEMFTKFSNKSRAMLLDGLSEKRQIALLTKLPEDISTDFSNYLDSLKSEESI